jgi:mono/diheme cytochrome c family protein
MRHKFGAWDGVPGSEAFDWSASRYGAGFVMYSNQGAKRMKGVCILIAVALLAATPILLWAAENGATLYDDKCSMCHGPKGEGNPEAKMPAVKGTSMTVEKLITYLTKGDKEKTIHADPVGDLNEEQAKAVVEFVKTLK